LGQACLRKVAVEKKIKGTDASVQTKENQTFSWLNRPGFAGGHFI
jgi:hypothetical protein